LYFSYLQTIKAKAVVERQCHVHIDEGNYVDYYFTDEKVEEIEDVDYIDSYCSLGSDHDVTDMLSKIDGNTPYLKYFMSLIAPGKEFVDLTILTAEQLCEVQRIFEEID
jgi:hypothetical protein